MRFVKVNTGANSGINLHPDPNWRTMDRELGKMQHINLTIDGVDDIQAVIDELGRHGITPAVGLEIQAGHWRLMCTSWTPTGSRSV